MLFDLQSGKRRRVVQVVYTLLAASFLIGFVIFGIGGTGSGIGDLFSDSSGDAPSTATQYERPIEDAEKELKRDPRDPKALEDLARYRYLSGIAQAESTQAGLAPTDATLSEWNLALDAWEKLLATDPQLDPTLQQVAGQMVTAYSQIDPDGGVATQRLITEEDPSLDNYANLAFFLYAAGKLEEGDKAAAQAVEKANGSVAKKLEKQFDQLAERARALEKAQQAGGQSATGEGALQNPFGGLGSDSGLPPAAP